MESSPVKDIILREFPAVDNDVMSYIDSILEEDFETPHDVYEALGEIFHDVSAEGKSEQDIQSVCQAIFNRIRPQNGEEGGGGVGVGVERGAIDSRKILDAPVNLGSLADDFEEKLMAAQSIWVTQKDDSLKVCAKKLGKAEAKIQQKLEKREKDSRPAPVRVELQSASVSQVINKKETRLQASTLSRNMDIRLENFDVTFGEKVLLQNADLMIVAQHRYGFCGRNGLGKTTLLRMISNGSLMIPKHITVLHVEQEVVGDETLAIDSVLECDFKRTELLRREKELLADKGNADHSAELTEIYKEMENIEVDKAIATASRILSGLGFTKEMQRKPTRTFSGGWRMRLALARALFSRPDLLLLDEPTNMLDIKAIIWLENYLQKWPTTLIVVSHDRNFLENVPTDILYLHSQRIDTYKGNYEQFEKTRAEKLKSQRREYEAQMAHRAHVQEFIDRFRYNANRAASVQSKIKMLEKLPELVAPEKEVDTVLKFPEVDPLNPPLLTLNEVGFKYADKEIFTSVDLSANLESRICIVGENGAGKTTLLKIVMGINSATRGSMFTHRNLKFGYFSQHFVDQLDHNLTCVEVLAKEFSGKTVEEYRRQLGSFGITGELALQSIASLSGGQKSRVAFAKICMARPNFLILDEPTNHLDIETIDALGKALEKYKGGVILVSHDERLIRMVSKELWICADKTVRSIEGGFDEYKRIVLKELEE